MSSDSGTSESESDVGTSAKRSGPKRKNEAPTDAAIPTKKAAVSAKAPPMTTFEKELLLQIVGKPKFKPIVENKGTNTVWTSQKDKAWDQISDEFCSNLTVVKRSGLQLRKAWENLKSRAKKQVAKVRKSHGKTGGGKKPKPVSPLSNRVVSIVPTQMVPLANDFDDDGCSEAERSETDTLDNSMRIEESNEESVNLVAIEPEKICPRKKQVRPLDKKRNLLAGPSIIIGMEEELQERKLKLLDLQIKREELNLRQDEEYHGARIKLVQMQIQHMSTRVHGSELQTISVEELSTLFKP